MYILDPAAGDRWQTYEQVEQNYEPDTLACDTLQLWPAPTPVEIWIWHGFRDGPGVERVDR